MRAFRIFTLAVFISVILSCLYVCIECTKNNDVETPITNEQFETMTDENTHQTESMATTTETIDIEETENPEDTMAENTTLADDTIDEVEDTKEAIAIIMYFTEKDVIALAKVLYNECRGVPSDMEKACVGWTACNRVDAGYGDTVYNVLTAPNQFAYRKNTPVTEELYSLALDVLTRWNDEKNGMMDVGRVLPKEYMWFRGDGKHNYFRNAFSGKYDIWDYSLDNPYDN